MGLFDTSAANLSTELGFVVILPRFQRTHVLSNAAGLLLHFALDTPTAGGLGLRRVTWKANPHNDRSLRAAERLGFRKEGILRWERVLPEWKTEAMGAIPVPPREGDSKPNCPGTDTAVLSLCWPDWEGGAREAVDALMQRIR